MAEQEIIDDLKETFKQLVSEMVSPIFQQFIPVNLIETNKERILQWLRRNKEKISRL